jgi:cellulose biosynthesis protein BcsQ
MTNVDRTTLERVVAVINGKGGVLKTTIVSNLAGMLAASGYRVLAVDLDPQGNLADDLGYTSDPRNDEGRALAGALMFGSAPAIYESVRPNLDVLVGGPELDQAAAGLAAKQGKNPQAAKLALAQLLTQLGPQYDIVLLDCPPGDEMLQTNAVAAARWALVPVKSDKASRRGLEAVAKRLDAVLDVNPDLDLLGVVLVDVASGAAAVEREARAKIAELFGSEDVVLAATVRHAESPAQKARERGLLYSELEQEKSPEWWKVRRGDANSSAVVPRTAASVAGDLQGVAQEVVDRLMAGAAQPEEQPA